MTNGNQNILVAGATGYVGGHLVPRLLQEGFPVRCMARSPDKLRDRDWQNINIVHGDALKPESLNDALTDIQVAYYLIHSMGKAGDFESKDVKAARNFSRACAENGVERIIYLGGLGNSGDELSSHLKSRQEVGRILGEHGIPVTELRASIIIGAGSSSFEIIRDLVKKLRIMITPKWVNSRCEPIAIRNVITYLVECLTTKETIGETLEIGGGEVFTYGDMMRQVGSLMGKQIIMFSVPVLTPRLSAYWLNLVTTVPMSIAYPLIDGLRNDTVCEDHRIRNWIPIDLKPFKEAVADALNEEELVARWTEARRATENYDLPDESKSLLTNKQIVTTKASPESIFHAVERIGGENGWYSIGWAWKLRGLMDRVIGGVGMRRGRRDPEELRAGDPLDFWRVLEIKRDRSLTLMAEMKLPGTAWLDFKISREGEDTKFIQTAIFEPSGWFGHIYWYLLLPIHPFIFRTMARNLVKYAEEHTN